MSPSRKHLQKIRALVSRILTPASLVPMTMENARGIKNDIGRILWFSDTSRHLLTNFGSLKLRDLVTTILDTRCFEGVADYGDVDTACREVISDYIESGKRPATGRDFFAAVSALALKNVETFWFAFPLIGMSLKATTSLQLGSFLVVEPSKEVLASLGVKFDSKRMTHLLELHKHFLWLISSARGTSRVAFNKARTAADQLTGFISMYLGTQYEKGGVGFSVRVGTSRQEMPNRSAWLSWKDSDHELISTWNLRLSEWLEVDDSHGQAMQKDGLLRYCFSLPTKPKPSALEEDILRAAIWLNDASRERLDSMRLLKLWSCAEIFFSTRTDTSQNVCEGLATILFAGPYPIEGEPGFLETRRRLKRLYDKRSRATHEGRHAEVTRQDCEALSASVCVLLVNAAALSLGGCTRSGEMKTALAARATALGIGTSKDQGLIGRIGGLLVAALGRLTK